NTARNRFLPAPAKNPRCFPDSVPDRIAVTGLAPHCAQPDYGYSPALQPALAAGYCCPGAAAGCGSAENVAPPAGTAYRPGPAAPTPCCVPPGTRPGPLPSPADFSDCAARTAD